MICYIIDRWDDKFFFFPLQWRGNWVGRSRLAHTDPSVNALVYCVVVSGEGWLPPVASGLDLLPLSRHVEKHRPFFFFSPLDVVETRDGYLLHRAFSLWLPEGHLGRSSMMTMRRGTVSGTSHVPFSFSPAAVVCPESSAEGKPGASSRPKKTDPKELRFFHAQCKIRVVLWIKRTHLKRSGSETHPNRVITFKCLFLLIISMLLRVYKGSVHPWQELPSRGILSLSLSRNDLLLYYSWWAYNLLIGLL